MLKALIANIRTAVQHVKDLAGQLKVIDRYGVLLRGWCEKEGFARIGFGESKGEILAAV